MASTTPRDTLNLRIRPDDRSLIDRAAAAAHKTRTDFVLDAARAAAEQTLLDQVVLSAEPQAYAAFLARLDEPVQPNEALRQTMQTRAPWDPAA
ncbi:DUF1778 domain-containing protein [Burkholderia glumae]|uniref:type II toxin-antitoxin system TacA family antitoxin n=1 Tax=Burkholderia glumae TaxID=337 RepID=UPI001373AF3D|nr:DUF1778 domain-containing protein [Burkholderia glumae]MCR1767227.1 DUF1778 domain-containing protein [Burkholderia glumae]QHP94291.1 DUF1778 domain-containing protein [Burkholderia glumae]QJP70531.1 DUF1778 domain-containing protein [Burkholderia glumae]QKM49782.1 hypothetical protein B7760_03840 [Burkholderia glumae]